MPVINTGFHLAAVRTAAAGNNHVTAGIDEFTGDRADQRRVGGYRCVGFWASEGLGLIRTLFPPASFSPAEPVKQLYRLDFSS